MPFAEGQSVSFRVTPAILHPASMDAANAYGVIIDGQPGPTWFNYRVQLCVMPKNTWLACWTQGGYESNPDQRVVTARSLDDGRTWSQPEVLRRCPGGEPFHQPCAPCPMSKLPDGRFVFLFHNTKPEGWGWYPRDPLWITVAREAPGVTANAGLYFSKPKVIIDNDGVPGGPLKDLEIGYPQFDQFGGKNYVAYANKTSQLRINAMPAALLDDAGLPTARGR